MLWHEVSYLFFLTGSFEECVASEEQTDTTFYEEDEEETTVLKRRRLYGVWILQTLSSVNGCELRPNFAKETSCRKKLYILQENWPFS